MTYGEAATQTVKGLAQQPMLLFLAVLNLFMIGTLLYVAKSQVEERRSISDQGSAMVKLLLEQCDGKAK